MSGDSPDIVSGVIRVAVGLSSYERRRLVSPSPIAIAEVSIFFFFFFFFFCFFRLHDTCRRCSGRPADRLDHCRPRAGLPPCRSRIATSETSGSRCPRQDVDPTSTSPLLAQPSIADVWIRLDVPPSDSGTKLGTLSSISSRSGPRTSSSPVHEPRSSRSTRVRTSFIRSSILVAVSRPSTSGRQCPSADDLARRCARIGPLELSLRGRQQTQLLEIRRRLATLGLECPSALGGEPVVPPSVLLAERSPSASRRSSHVCGTVEKQTSRPGRYRSWQRGGRPGFARRGSASSSRSPIITHSR